MNDNVSHEKTLTMGEAGVQMFQLAGYFALAETPEDYSSKVQNLIKKVNDARDAIDLDKLSIKAVDFSSKEGGRVKYNYVTLGSLHAATRGALIKSGLQLTCNTVNHEANTLDNGLVHYEIMLEFTITDGIAMHRERFYADDVDRRNGNKDIISLRKTATRRFLEYYFQIPIETEEVGGGGYAANAYSEEAPPPQRKKRQKTPPAYMTEGQAKAILGILKSSYDVKVDAEADAYAVIAEHVEVFKILVDSPENDRPPKDWSYLHAGEIIKAMQEGEAK